MKYKGIFLFFIEQAAPLSATYQEGRIQYWLPVFGLPKPQRAPDQSLKVYASPSGFRLGDRQRVLIP